MSVTWNYNVSLDRIISAGWTPKRVVPLPESAWYFVECTDAWGNETSAIIDRNGEFVNDRGKAEGFMEESSEKLPDRLILI